MKMYKFRNQNGSTLLINAADKIESILAQANGYSLYFKGNGTYAVTNTYEEIVRILGLEVDEDTDDKSLIEYLTAELQHAALGNKPEVGNQEPETFHRVWASHIIPKGTHLFDSTEYQYAFFSAHSRPQFKALSAWHTNYMPERIKGKLKGLIFEFLYGHEDDIKAVKNQTLLYREQELKMGHISPLSQFTWKENTGVILFSDGPQLDPSYSISMRFTPPENMWAKRDIIFRLTALLGD